MSYVVQSRLETGFDAEGQLHAQVHIAAGDHTGLIEACARLGDVSRGGDPHLWTEVVQYFGSQNYDCSAQVTALNLYHHKSVPGPLSFDDSDDRGASVLQWNSAQAVLCPWRDALPSHCCPEHSVTCHM